MTLQAQAAFALVQAAPRLKALAAYDVMDSVPEPEFDDIVAMAAHSCSTPISTITLIDEARQWFKACVGFIHTETPLVQSVCADTLDQPGLLVIADLTQDPRTCSNPGVTGAPHLRFYARMRIDSDGGEPLGTLCVIDYVPRPAGLTVEQADILAALGRQVMVQLELRKAIIERDRQKAALIASQARLRAIFETSYQFQSFLSVDGTLLDANAHALSAIQCELNDIVGLPLWQAPWFTATPGMPATIEAATRAATKGETVRREVEIELPTGPRILDFSWRPVFDEDGAVIGIVAEGLDLTEYRRVETRLRQAQKMEAVGQLTGGIAHDFNNMLAIVIGFLDLARRKLKTPGDKTAVYLDHAADGAARALTLTKRLLNFSRHQPLDPKPMDANGLIGGMAELLSRALGERIHLDLQLAVGLWPICVDKAQLENALVNLAINGRDAMFEGGTLRISTENADVAVFDAALGDLAPGPYVVVAVSDGGVGMSPTVIEHAFEPFYTTKRVGEGSGLGLSQVFGFAHQSGGLARIESSAGRGTTVRLYLPRHAGSCGAATQTPSATPIAPVPRDTIVLVVEDEAHVRMMSIETLTELGYRVAVAETPADALRQIETNPAIGLLFTDIVMPGMTGPQLAERATAARPTLKVLFTTGYQHKAGLDLRDKRRRAHPRQALLDRPARGQGAARAGRLAAPARSSRPFLACACDPPPSALASHYATGVLRLDIRARG